MAVITISRQFGAGGKTLGKLVSKNLGYTLFDEEIIQKVAAMAKVSTSWVKTIERDGEGRLQSFVAGLLPFRRSFVEKALENQQGYIDEEVYVDMLQKVIVQIAEENNAVIIGRGGQYVLADSNDVYHVFLVARKQDRIKFMEENYNLPRMHAEQVVTRQSRRRANLYKKFGREDFEKPYHYHLVLNMSKMSMTQAASYVCTLVSSACPIV